MSDDQYTKLFRYLQKQLGDINQQLEVMATKDDLAQIYEILDKQAAILEDLQIEDTAATASHRRLEKQIQFVADETGVDLSRLPA